MESLVRIETFHWVARLEAASKAPGFGITQTPTRANAAITSMDQELLVPRPEHPPYNGIPKAHFHLFIKETEFRFNYGTPSQQLRSLKRWTKINS